MTQMSLKELFDKISEKYGTEFPVNEMVEAPCDLYTTDENGNEVKITHLIIKEDEIYKIEFEENIPDAFVVYKSQGASTISFIGNSVPYFSLILSNNSLRLICVILNPLF